MRIMEMGGNLIVGLITRRNPLIKSHGSPLLLLFSFCFLDQFFCFFPTLFWLVTWEEKGLKPMACLLWGFLPSCQVFMRHELPITPGEVPKDIVLLPSQITRICSFVIFLCGDTAYSLFCFIRYCNFFCLFVFEWD